MLKRAMNEGTDKGRAARVSEWRAAFNALIKDIEHNGEK